MGGHQSVHATPMALFFAKTGIRNRTINCRRCCRSCFRCVSTGVAKGHKRDDALQLQCSIHCRAEGDLCKALPANKKYFVEHVDLVLDNKHFDVPTTDAARLYKAKMKVRFQIRTRGEGLMQKYTKLL